MTLIVPGPLEKRENFLIGRAAEREEFLRMTRLTEVVPEHSNIVGGGQCNLISYYESVCLKTPI